MSRISEHHPDKEAGNGLIRLKKSLGKVPLETDTYGAGIHPPLGGLRFLIRKNNLNNGSGSVRMAEIPGNRMYGLYSPSLESQAKAGVLAYEGRPWVKVKGVRGDFRIDKISFRGCTPVPELADLADTAPA